MAETDGLDAADLLAGIRSWVAIETPTTDAPAVNRLIGKVHGDLEDAGVAVERLKGRDGFGDCLRIRSPWGGERKGVLVTSHLDTVWPIGTLERMPYRVDGDIAYGPGIYDMKSGSYLAFHCIHELIARGRETPLALTFLFTPDEEVGSPTSRALIEEEGARAAWVLVPEPGSLPGGSVVTGRKGSARFRMKILGRGAHSSGAHKKGRSAVIELAHQILALAALTDYERGVTTNIAPISGGMRPNVVPAEAVIDLRFTRAADGEAFAKTILGRTPITADVKVEVSGRIMRPPMEKTEANMRLYECAREVAADLGFALPEQFLGGGSDGNFTANQGVATLDGLGALGAGAHTEDEHIVISSLIPRGRLLQGLLKSLS